MNTIETKAKKNWWSIIGVNLALIVIFAFFLFPIIWMVGMSFKSIEDILSWPPKFIFTPTLANYRAIITSTIEQKGVGNIPIDFMASFWNTLIISFSSVLVSVLLGVTAAYAIRRFKLKGREKI